MNDTRPRPFGLRQGFGILILFCTVPAILTLPGVARSGQPETSTGGLANHAPAGASVYAETRDLAELIERVRQLELVQKIKDNPQYQKLRKQNDFQRLEAARRFLELQYGDDAWGLAKKLLGKQLAVALYPNRKRNQPDALVLVRADRELLERIWKQSLALLQLTAPDKVQSEKQDKHEIMHVDGKLFAALAGDYLTLASRRDLLSSSIDLQNGVTKDSLAKTPRFQSAAMRFHAGQQLVGFADMNSILRPKGEEPTLPKYDNALAALLFGDAVTLGSQANWAAVTFQWNDDVVKLTSFVDGKVDPLPPAYQGFFGGKGAGNLLPRPQRAMGSFSFRRDMVSLYQQREKVMQEHILPEFDKFESGLSNLLPGKNFGLDVLPLFGKTMTFVVAGQDYGHLPVAPGVQIPGFALVADLAKPQEGAETVQLFFQTLVTILNLTAKQQGGEPMVLGSEQYKGVNISTGKYLSRPTAKSLPIIFNFMPASASVGEHFIFSSSLGLCRDLIDELKTKSGESVQVSGKATAGARNFALEILPSAIADNLQANKDLLLAREIQKGNDAAEASNNFDLGMQLLRRIASITLQSRVLSEGFEVSLEAKYQ